MLRRKHCHTVADLNPFSIIFVCKPQSLNFGNLISKRNIIPYHQLQKPANNRFIVTIGSKQSLAIRLSPRLVRPFFGVLLFLLL